MKKIILISAAVLAVAAGAFYYVQSAKTCGDMCGHQGSEKSGSYSLKMSMMCERSCAAQGVDKSKVVAQSAAHVGDYTQCPVSGVVFEVTNESTQVKDGNKQAYTCCANCATMFNEAPKEYLQNIN
jgi:hypothetical protein